jgi:sigma-B regulation protein RsbQ
MLQVDAVGRVATRNNVRTAGNPSARPIVLSHGFGCSQEVWRDVAPAFADDHFVVTFDLVGAGGSDATAYSRSKYDSLEGYATDLLELLEELDLHDVVYVGHSVSSMIGVLAANRAPERFGALVLVGPSPRYTNTEGYIGGFEPADIDGLLDALDSNYLGWSTSMAPVIMGNADRPALGAELTASFCAVQPDIARHFARVTFLSDNRDDLPKVTVPTLVLQCSDDLIAPDAVGRFVHESIPASAFVQLEAVGHCPNLSAPDELIAVIRQYLG